MAQLTVYQPLPVRVRTRTADARAIDALVVPLFEDDDLAGLDGFDEATGGELGRARGRGELLGKPFELFVTPLAGESWTTARAIVVGAGLRRDWNGARARRVATTGALAARQRRLGRIAVMNRTPPSDGQSAREGTRIVQAIAEGVCLANYDGASYRTADPPRFWLESADIIVSVEAAALEVAAPGVAAFDAAAERGRVLGDHTNMARALSNEPGNTLTPIEFAARAASIAQGAGLMVEVLDEAQIATLGMGLLLGVARGSVEPPRLIVLTYDPSGLAPGGPVLGLVGKGVTFDTGGISIKPAENMDKMKDDMSGGAAVIAAMAALARLRAPVRVIGVVPMVENMPGGRAIKPGDILRGASGKTVEVLNTDAEGRLILGDALWYARQKGATHLVDIATLTGACLVALGRTTTGVFGAPDSWLNDVLAAGDRAGDRSWPMPIFEDYKDLFKSDIADMTNTGGRMAGATTAALFLKEFAGDLPWVHMDIAGTSWAEDAKPYQPKGATGAGVRTLAELALAVETWRSV